MALSPISTYQNQDNSLVQLLKGGSGEISSIMDKAIQVGRDISNKQLAQEQDLLAIRKNETALSQRRAENLQQDNEDAMRFARNAYEFDTKFGSDSAFREQQAQRQGEQDAFQNEQSTTRLGLAQNADKRAEADQGFQEKKFNAEQAALKRQEGYYADGYGNQQPATGVDTQSPNFVGPPNPATSQDPNFVGPPKPAIQTQPAADAGVDLYAERERLESDLRNAPKNPALQAEIARKKGIVEGKIAEQRALATANKPKSPEQQAAAERAARDQAMQEANFGSAKAKEEAKGLYADTGAFGRQESQAASLTKADGENDEAFKARVAKAQALGQDYDKGGVDAEISSAQNYGEEAYVNFKGMELTQAQKDKRRKLWQYANGLKGDGTVPATPAGAPPVNPAKAALDKLLGR